MPEGHVDIQLTDPWAQRLTALSKAGLPAIVCAMMAWFMWLVANSSTNVHDELRRINETLRIIGEQSVKSTEILRRDVEIRERLFQHLTGKSRRDTQSDLGP